MRLLASILVAIAWIGLIILTIMFILSNGSVEVPGWRLGLYVLVFWGGFCALVYTTVHHDWVEGEQEMEMEMEMEMEEEKVA